MKTLKLNPYKITVRVIEVTDEITPYQRRLRSRCCKCCKRPVGHEGHLPICDNCYH